MDASQLPLALDGVLLDPTVAIRRGEALVVQCSWCGLLVCANANATLGECPAGCGRRGAWTRQQLPVGPFRSEYRFSEAA